MQQNQLTGKKMEDNRVVVFFTKKGKIKRIFRHDDIIVDFDEHRIVSYRVADSESRNVYIIHDSSLVDLNEIINDRIGYFVYHNETEDKLKSLMEDLGFQGRPDHNVHPEKEIARGYYAWLYEVGVETLKGDEISKEQFEALWGRFETTSDLEGSLNLLNQIFDTLPLSVGDSNKYLIKLDDILAGDIDMDIKEFIVNIKSKDYRYGHSQRHLLSELRDLLLLDILNENYR